MKDTTNPRADAYRHVAERQFYFLLGWVGTTAVIGWLFGWWALVPGVLALRSLALCMISLSRENRLRRGA
jgi:hypothetical protein